MPWNLFVAALLVVAGAFGALAVSLATSLGIALLLGGKGWPQAEGDELRGSGAVAAAALPRPRGH